MTDTAQPALAAENALDSAADAFKSFLNPEPVQTRDESGRFASEQVEEEEVEEVEAPDDGDEDDEQDDDETAEEAQSDAPDLPSSWSKDDAELWQSLPPEAQAKIAEREAQRDAGLNLKLQEAANARKLIEQQAAQANAFRDQYAVAIDEVMSMVSYPKPNPQEYGLGTEYYDRDAYDLAAYQWEQSQQQVSALKQQRQYIAAQQEQEAEQARKLAHAEIEQVSWPKFLNDVPELTDPTKGRQVVLDVISYAKGAGIPAHVFDNPDIAKDLTSAELHLAWKAMQYDRIKSAEKRVKAGNPPPKPSGPVVRPGGSTNRQTVQANRLSKAQSRLAKEGSVEAGADVFKQLFR